MGVLRASWRPLGPSWARLGASWAVLERRGAVLEPSWGVLGASWGVPSAKRVSAVPESELICGLGDPSVSKMNKENRSRRRTCSDFFRPGSCRNPDTQLGAFGPGADPKRSRAANPPSRSGVYHLIFGGLRIGFQWSGDRKYCPGELPGGRDAPQGPSWAPRSIRRPPPVPPPATEPY